MSDTQHQGEGRGRQRRLRTLALVTAAALFGLAYATPAHADDQAPPPQLMLGKSAVIVPDEPDATMDVAAPAPATPSQPAPVVEPAPVKTPAADDGWELAAKPHQWRHAERDRAPAATPPEAPPAVISTPVRAAHPVRPHKAVSRAVRVVSADPPQWYQVPDTQYREGRPVGGAGHSVGVSRPVQTADVRTTKPANAHPQMSRAVCGFRGAKCLQLCAAYAPYKVVQNGRWIGLCIFAPTTVSGLDAVHRQLIERLSLLALNDRAGLSALQYQCLGRQYQSQACTGPASGGATDAARQTGHPPAVHERSARRSTGVATKGAAAVPLRGRAGARVLAAVATHRTRIAKTARPRPLPEHAIASRPGGATAAATHSAPAAPSGDWLLRALIALTGVAVLSFLLAAVSRGTRPAAVFTAVRSRLGSKGLSTARVVLGEGGRRRVRRRGGIAYRD